MKLFGDVSQLYISEYYYCMFTFWKLCLIGKWLTPWRDYSSSTSETASSKQSCRLSHYQSRLVALPVKHIASIIWELGNIFPSVGYMGEKLTWQYGSIHGAACLGL
jgi:hypothetical protein